MRAAQVVQLHAHNGRMLTLPEVLIEQFHEMRNAEQKKIVDEKMSEKMMMSRISSKLISMPSVRSVAFLITRAFCSAALTLYHTNHSQLPHLYSLLLDKARSWRQCELSRAYK